MTRRIACVLVLLTLIFALSQAYANGQAPGELGHPHMWGHGGGWGWMIFGPLMMIVVIASIVALVVLLVRWLGGGARPAESAPPGKAPLDILKARFARGEIDKEEYEERKRLLSD